MFGKDKNTEMAKDGMFARLVIAVCIICKIEPKELVKKMHSPEINDYLKEVVKCSLDELHEVSKCK